MQRGGETRYPAALIATWVLPSLQPWAGQGEPGASVKLPSCGPAQSWPPVGWIRRCSRRIRVQAAKPSALKPINRSDGTPI